MPEEDNSLEKGYNSSAYSSSLESAAPVVQPVVIKRGTPLFKFNKLAFAVTGGAVAVILLIAGISLLLNNIHLKKAETVANQKGSFSSSNLSLQGVSNSDQLKVGNADKLAVNGQLHVSNTVVLTPTSAPDAPEVGQIYYDKTTNSLYYYNGSAFVPVATQNAIVSSLGGMTGAVNTGAGLSAVGGSLQNTGVLSVQGQTGIVNFTAGGGVTISGTTISTTALPAGQLVLGTGASGFTTVAQASSAGQCLISTPGAPVFGSCTGTTQVTSLNSLVNAVTLAAGAGVTITPAGNTLTIAAPASAAITAINGQNGPTLTVANATAASNIITINNASADGSTKGIAAFNATNFSSASGIINTIQGISTTASPTFANLTSSGFVRAVELRNSSNVVFTLPTSGITGSTRELCYVDDGNLSNCPTGGNVSSSGSHVAGTVAIFTGTGQGISDSALVQTGSGASTLLTGNAGITLNTGYVFTGNGSGLDTLNANNISSGTLAVGRGGTGAGSFTLNGVLIGNGSSAFNVATSSGSGKCFISTLGAPTFQDCPVGGNVSAGSSSNDGYIALFDGSDTVISKSSLSQDINGDINSDGAITIVKDSIAALSVQDASNADVLVVDTINKLVGIGTAPDSVLLSDVPLQVNGALRVTPGVDVAIDSDHNGTIFYNALDDAFYIVEAGLKKKLCNTTDQGCGAGANQITLQGAYDNGDGIITTDSTGLKDIVFNLDGTQDASFLVNLQAGNSTGRYAVQSAGTDIFSIDTAGATLDVPLAVTTANGLTLGTSNGTDGAVVFKNSSNGNTVTLLSGVTTSSYSLKLPTSAGSNGDCLKYTTGGQLGYTTCLTGGGSGGGVIDLNGESGSVSLQSSDSSVNISVPSSGVIDLTVGSGFSAVSSINSATGTIILQGVTNRISINESPSGTFTISTPQDINTTSSPSFAGLTVTSGGISVTGNSTITGTLGSLTGLTSSGAITFSGLGTGIVQSNGSGLLSSSSISRTSSLFTGQLNVSGGGTGVNTFASNGVLYGNGTGAIQATTAGSAGQVLIANASNVPTFTTITGDTTVDGLGATTVAALQGTTLTLSGIASGEVLQYNGTALVNAKITNSNLTAGAFGNITGTGALASGSLTTGFGTINIGSNITTSTNIQGANINATTALQVGGTDINTAGTLSNVAYLNAASNTFTGSGGITIQGSSGLTLGTTGQIGNFVLHDGSGQTTTLQAGNSSTDLTFVLPTSAGTTNQCIKKTTGNQLFFDDCLGGSGGSGGVSSIGAIDTGTLSSNGAFISGSSLYLQSATALYPGLVNTGAQTFAGAKTFNGLGTFAAGITVTGANSSINTSSNFNTNINTGTSTGSVGIGNSAAGAISLQSAGSISLTPGGTGDTGVIIQPSAVTTQAFRVNNHGGSPMIIADTNAGEVQTTRLYVSVGSSTPALEVNQNSTGNIFQANDSGTAVFTVADGGAATFKNSTNSTTAFQIQSAGGSGTNLLTADTTNMRLRVGSIGTATSQLYVAGQVASSFAGSVATGSSAPQAIAVQGRYAYVVLNGSAKLASFDLSNPASPAALSSLISTGTAPAYIAVQGKYAYVVNTTSNTLQVFDISNPKVPAAVGSIATGSGPTSVAVQGRYAYVTNGTAATVTVYDVGNPTLPAAVGSALSLSTTNPYNIFISGRYAYVVNQGSNNFKIIDISNPASLSVVGTSTTVASSAPRGIYVQGRYAYVTEFGNHVVRIYDVSDPTTPGGGVGSVSTGSSTQPRNIVVNGRYAYVTLYQSHQLAIIDVSNPASPSLIGTPTSLGSGQNPFSLAVQGRYAYITNETSNTLKTVDLGGAYVQQLEAGSLEATSAAINNDLSVGGSGSFQGGLNVAGTANIQGNLSASGSALFAANSNQTNAFQIQNASGSSIFNVDTTGTNLISNGSFETNSTGWTTVSRTSGLGGSPGTYYAAFPASVATGGSSYSSTANLTSTLSTSTTYTLSFYAQTYQAFPASTPSITASFGGSTCTTVTPGYSSWTKYTCTITTGGGAYSTVTFSNTLADQGFCFLGCSPQTMIDGVRLELGSSAGAYRDADFTANGAFTSPVLVAQNSSSAFQIANASGTALLNANTTTMNVAVTSDSSTSTALTVAANSLTTGGGLNVSTTSSVYQSGNLASINQSATATTPVLLGSSLLNVSRAISTSITGTPVVTLDSANNGTGANSTSISWTHAVGSYSNRALVVSVGVWVSSAGGNPTCTSTYAGTSMTLLDSRNNNGGPWTYKAFLFGLAAPSVGSNTVAISCNAGNTTVGQSSSWYNVDQSTPFAGTTGTTATSTTATLPVSGTTVNDKVVDSWFSGGSLMTPGAGQTGYGSYSAQPRASYKTGAVTSTSVSWTTDTSSQIAYSATAVKAVATPSAQISGSLTNIQSNCAVGTGSCVDTSTLLNINQQYASASGAVVNIQNAGTGSALTIQNASSTTLFSADTTNQRIKIGNNTGTATAQLYVGPQIASAALGSVSVGSFNLAYKLATQGRYVYAALFGGNAITAYDFTNPASPIATGGSYTTTAAPRGIAVVGKYAYVVTSTGNKLEIVDISNPASFTGMSTLSLSTTTANNIFVQGRYAYIVDQGSAKLQIVDISNPASPVSVSTLTLGAVVSSVGLTNLVVQGRYAYIAEATKFEIVDISNPASPVIRSSRTINAVNVAIQGRYAYVCDYPGTCGVYDIKDPTSTAASVGSFTMTGNNWYSLAVQGNYIYGSNSSVLQTVDITNPTSPTVVGSTSGIGGYQAIVQGRYAYVGTLSTIVSVDLGGTYSQSLEAGQIEAGSLATRSNLAVGGDADVKGGLTVAGATNLQGNFSVMGLLFADGSTSRISVGAKGTSTAQLYISGQTPSAYLGQADAGSGSAGIAVQGRYAFLVPSDGTTGYIKSYDVSNPAAPIYVDNVTPNKAGNQTSSGASNKKIKIQGKYAYVAGGGTLQVFDISNPYAPASVGTGTYTSSGTTTALYVQGRYAYVGSSTQQALYVFDITNPSSIPTPTAVTSGFGASSVGPVDIFAQGRYVYVANNTSSTNAFQIIDMSNPSSPSVTAGSLSSTTGTPSSLTVQGRYAYLGTTSNLYAIDISNPASLTSSNISLGGPAKTLTSQSRYLYIGDSTNGVIRTADISIPSSPVLVTGTVAAVSPFAMQAVGRYLYVSNNNNTNTIQTFDLGGAYAQQLETGAIETDVLNVRGNSNFASDVAVQGSLSVGTNAQIQGNVSISGETKHSGNLIAGNYQTSTTATTSGSNTNTTTLVFTGTTSFACGDVVFIDNAGQDYYTRITSCPGTAASVTVSPAVDYDNGVTVRKYIVQNIGSISTSAAIPSNSDRFFQGYFLGGVVTGAGSTTLSDGRLQSSGALNYIATSHAFTSTNTTQNGLALSSDALTTGSGLSVTTSSTTLASGSLLNVAQNSNYTSSSSSSSSSQLLNLSRTVANNATAPNVAYNTGTTVNGSTTAAITVGANNNRLLVAGGMGNFSCTSFTWAVSGFSTQNSTSYTIGPGFMTYVYLVNPNPGAGTLTCNATLYGAVTSWYNVDQTTPFSGNSAGCNGSGGSIATGCTITLSSGEGLLQGAYQGSSYSCYNRTPTSGTKLGQYCVSSAFYGHSTLAGTSGTVTMAWGYPEGDTWAIEGLAIKRATPTVAYSGSLASISSNCTAAANTLCTDTSNLLSITQSSSTASGSVVKIQNAGTGADLELGSGIIRPTTNSTTAVRIQNAAGTNTLFSVDSVNSLIKVALGSGSASSAICSTLSNGVSPTAGTAYELRDCNSAPAADYAENYPVAAGITYGDIVATGTNMVNTYDVTDGSIDWSKVKGQVTQLVKTGSPYQKNTIGIVSDNYGDFTSAGYNIKPEDNPMPVALNGRVPVNVSPSSAPIAAGDYLTTSGDTGKAMKATGAGFVIGKALASWTPGSGAQVMVYVEPGYYDGPTITDYIQNGGNGSLIDLNVSGAATIQTLTVTGVATFQGGIIVGGHIVTQGTAPSTSVLAAAGAGATIDVDGNDTAGTITLTIGSGASAGDIANLIFSHSFSKTPKTILSPQDEASQDAKIFPTGKSSGSFKLKSSQVLQPGTYTFDYFIVQ